jgi:hypothetical protein
MILRLVLIVILCCFLMVIDLIYDLNYGDLIIGDLWIIAWFNEFNIIIKVIFYG